MDISEKNKASKDAYAVMRSYLSIGRKMDIALLAPVLATLVIAIVATTGLELGSAVQVDVTAVIAVIGFLVPLLMIFLVSMKLNK